MRPILHGDVSSTARALLMIPFERRRDLCGTLIRQADKADQHARRTGYPHPRWGNGSLMSAARKHVLATEPGFDNLEYCQCFEMVLQMLIEWRVNPMHS